MLSKEESHEEADQKQDTLARMRSGCVAVDETCQSREISVQFRRHSNIEGALVSFTLCHGSFFLSVHGDLSHVTI